jgi:8-oxo-dGTP diphosphatase / 2-hydroxy-dATP diphosphatase
MQKLLTLVFIMQNDRILLGYKKRGFGAERWNGFGGKVEEGETIEEAAKREVAEECSIEVESLEKRAVHTFIFDGKDEVLEVHTFLTTRWRGEPKETSEMRPEWFNFTDIPYDTMWSDDRYWLPRFLAGEKLRTKFLFGQDDDVLEYDIQIDENI